MRKVISFIVLMALCVFIVGCSKTYHGTDELIEKARKEIPISDADTIEIQYAGMSGSDDKALVWFVSGNEYQAHYYFPMEVNIKGEAEYTFEKVYKPMEQVKDIAV
jgi:hypothetical protein